LIFKEKPPNGPHRVYEGEREVIKENEKKKKKEKGKNAYRSNTYHE
jgi:hypothetical protein